jgi:hypothetical protein
MGLQAKAKSAQERSRKLPEIHGKKDGALQANRWYGHHSLDTAELYVDLAPMDANKVMETAGL